MKVAILGFGTIGSGVYKIISERTDMEVLHILDLPENKYKSSLITSELTDIVNDSNVDVVVETMGGIHPAYEFIMQCLKNKKHVVSANKAVIALHLDAFLATAKENGVSFLFEASVGGGIPWIASLLKASRVDEVDQLYGIFNGTSNFILDDMISNQKQFEASLSLAQELGYAEANPAADVDGYDVQNKIAISSRLAFQSQIDMNDFMVHSMRNISFDDIQYLKQKNCSVRYIGEAKRIANKYEAIVMLNVFKQDSVEANIKTNFNIATLHGATIGPLKFYGQGAGQLATANAIIQDIIDIQVQSQINIIETRELVYSDTLQTHQFMIRTTNQIEKNKYIDTLEKYKENYYITTKFITCSDFKHYFYDMINADQNAVVAKVANF